MAGGQSRWAIAGALALAACGGDWAELRRGGVRVELSVDEGLVIRRDGEVLLASHRGATVSQDPTRPGEAYAPFAAAHTESRTVEEIYGFFRFAEAIEPYARLPLGEIEAADGVLRFAVGARGRGRLSIDDGGAVRLSWEPGRARRDRLAMSFACAPGERFFGLGAQVSVEHRGHRVPIWTSEQGVSKSAQGEPPLVFGLTGAHYDSYAPVPFVLSSRPLGLWLAGEARSELELCAADAPLRLETAAGSFDLVIYTGTMREALAAFTAETGRPAPVPAWAFGPWIDTFGGPAGIEAAVTTLRGRGIPASAVWSEDWVGTTAALGGENLTYDWREDPARYPDLGATAARVHAAGLRFLVYVNPFFPEDADVYPAAVAADALVRDEDGEQLAITWPWGPPVALFDPTAAGAARFFAETLGRVEALGVDGWMADYGEALPYAARLADGGVGPTAHNRYPLAWADANARFWRAARPDDDWAIFSRSGYTGIAAATRIHWLGDQMTSFDRNDGLGSVVPLYLSAGLSGIALTHSDVGGYTSFATTVRSEELFARWLELEAFTPFLRTHHTSNPANNLQWHTNEQTLSLVETYFRWHQALAPTFAALVGEAQATGAPPVRPLWWADEAEQALFAVDDAFLLGDALLVAPIVVAGQTEREVLLPPGSWRRWSALEAPLGEPLTGLQTLAAAVDEAIVMVRAGAGIALLADAYDTLAPTRAGVTLDPGLVAAPAVIERFRLLLAGGGSGAGASGGPGLAPFAWDWQGDAAAGVVVSAELDGTALAACTTGAALDCLDGAVVRLAPAVAPRAVKLSTAGGVGTLTLRSAGASVLVEVR